MAHLVSSERWIWLRFPVWVVIAECPCLLIKFNQELVCQHLNQNNQNKGVETVSIRRNQQQIYSEILRNFQIQRMSLIFLLRPVKSMFMFVCYPSLFHHKQAFMRSFAAWFVLAKAVSVSLCFLLPSESCDCFDLIPLIFPSFPRLLTLQAFRLLSK